MTDWSQRRDHVVVCGLHDEGLRVVEQLSLAGVDVVVVDVDPDPRLPEMLKDLGVPWIDADSGRPETLARAGIAGARAVVCVESDDLRTLASALLARELRPDLRVVAQLRNAAVGRALGEVGVVVLDTAALAAPSFVESCLESEVRALRLGDRDFLLVRTTVPRTASLRASYGDLAPVALAPADGPPLVGPSRDVEAQAGDAVVLVGPAEAVRAAGLVQEHRPERWVGARAPRAEEVSSRPVNRLRYLATQVDRRLVVVLSGLLALATTSVVVLLAGYREPDGTRMSAVDAVYFTVETMGTVGFGDFYFRDQPTWLRLWAIVLMVAGATIVAGFFALLTNALVSRTFGRSLGGRQVTGLSRHVVVVGAGSVGVATVERLVAQEVPVVVVESDPDNRFLAQIRSLGVPVVLADAALPGTWRTVRLDHARAVVVLTSDDLVNIETGLTVRGLVGERGATVPVVLRLFDARLSATLASGFRFGKVRSPAVLAAPWFVGAALGLDVLETLYVADQPVLLARLRVADGSSLAGVRLADALTGTRVVLIRSASGEESVLPARTVRIGAGDEVTLIGPYDELLRVLRADAPSTG